MPDRSDTPASESAPKKLALGFAERAVADAQKMSAALDGNAVVQAICARSELNQHLAAMTAAVTPQIAALLEAFAPIQAHSNDVLAEVAKAILPVQEQLATSFAAQIAPAFEQMSKIVIDSPKWEMPKIAGVDWPSIAALTKPDPTFEPPFAYLPPPRFQAARRAEAMEQELHELRAEVRAMHAELKSMQVPPWAGEPPAHPYQN